MDETNISNKIEGISLTASAETFCESTSALNSDLIGFTFSDEADSEIRVVAACSVNPDRYVIVERTSGGEGLKTW